MPRYNPENIIDDEEVISKIDDWEISISKTKKRIYINTVSYHLAKLGFTRTQ
jgi:hypothetical protein